jgi:urease accessory protein
LVTLLDCPLQKSRYCKVSRFLRGKFMHLRSFLVLVLSLAALSQPCAAHTGEGAVGGLLSGLSHPLFGFDHLLAMLAVGIWGAQMGGRLVWTLPVAFPLVMAVGGLLGMAGFTIPHVETGIALSVLALGLVIALALRPTEAIALLLIGVFAIFHGYAHGVELPAAVDPAAYAVGFVIATGLIHVLGIGIGLSVGKAFAGRLSRGIGSLIAAAGVYFLIA